jgi:hypothetical protein
LSNIVNALAQAQEHNLPPDAMPTKLFVISDMEFDTAGGRSFETNFQVLKKKFRYLQKKILLIRLII